jgi:hypothetical protein
MLSVQAGRIPRDHQFYLLAAGVDSVIYGGNNTQGMFLKRTPRKTAFQQEWCHDQKDQPRCIPAKKEEREGKETYRHQPEKYPGPPLDGGCVSGRPPPPADKPAKQGHRVVRRMRVADSPVDGERKD